MGVRDARSARKPRAAPTLYNAAALRKGHRKGVTRDIVAAAIARLVRNGPADRASAGQERLLFARRFDPSRSSGPTLGLRLVTARSTRRFHPPRFGTAYDTLVREIGFADVPIADLYERAGVSMEVSPDMAARGKPRGPGGADARRLVAGERGGTGGGPAPARRAAPANPPALIVSRVPWNAHSPI